MEEKLEIFEGVKFNEAITKQEYHTYYPRVSNFNSNDEIRISIQHQDIYTLPSESFIYIDGMIEEDSGTGTCNLTNNPYAFLFEQIRYEINGVEVDRCTKPGITSTMKAYVSYNDNESKYLELAGWSPNGGVNQTNKHFNAYIPLRFLLGFAEDYRKIVANASQELVLLRSSSDLNSFQNEAGTKTSKFKISKIEWHVPHIVVNDEVRLQILKKLGKDEPIYIGFRKWELYELPSLRKTKTDIWPIKTSTNLEKPRYVILAFQSDRRDKLAADASKFDHNNITNIKLHLNEEGYPYDKMNLSFDEKKYAIAYRMYAGFQSSYYEKNAEPLLSYEKFKDTATLYVIDCSNQKEAVKTSVVDIKLEMEAFKAFDENTTAYCLILHDNIIEYRPLSGTVRKLI